MFQAIRPDARVWSVALLAAGCAANGFFVCGGSLAAFGAIAAATLPLRWAIALAFGVWIESQALGFGAFGYPRDLPTVAQGGAMAVALFGAVIIANRIPLRGVLRFLAAFAGYEVVLAGISLGAHWGRAGFTARIVAEVLADNAVVWIGLLALYRVVGALESAVADALNRRGRQS